MSFTLTSHDLGKLTGPAAEHRATQLHRRIVRESFGWPQAWSLWQNQPMTPWGYPMSAAPFARGASGTPTDRLGGRDIPLYWNEVDLRGFRVLSKFLTDTNQFGKGFLNRLVDYHVRKGFGWQACRRGHKKTAYPTVATDDPLLQRAQTILDYFRDAVQWPLVSREAFRRLQRDGEVFGRFGIYEGRAWFRFVAADQVGNPSGDTTSPQSFGIETDPDDICDPWAYHVWDVADYPAGGEWIDASDVIHVKANVDSDVKRGLPSFFPVQDNLDIVRKLLSNMLGSAQKMAAVAWREKFPTASATQVQQLIPMAAQSDLVGVGPGPYGSGYPGWNGGVNGFQHGEVIKVEGNREYEEGPTAAGVANFIEAEQAALRGAAVSFGFPESIATGKIDDINFAAALTTGAPFAVAIEGGQFEYGCRWERASALKVYDLAYRRGLLSSEELRQLDVEITEPAPMIAEPDKESERRVKLVTARILSPQTAQLQEQLDPQHEQANWDAWDEANPPQPLPVDQNVEPNDRKQIGPESESKDATGHEHVGKGSEKGGQFAKTGGGDASGKSEKPKLSPDEKKAASDAHFEELMGKKNSADAKNFRQARADGVAIPPAWTDVVYHGAAANIIAEGRDDKGRKQRAENPQYRQNISDANNARITKELRPRMDELRDELRDAAKAGNEEAKVLYLITLTGFRIGGKGDGKAKEQAFGASSLMGDHVKIDGNTVTFDFPGKKGVRQQHSVTDPVIAKMMASVEPGKPVFSTRDTKVRDAWQTKYGGEKVHDIRHVVATEIAERELDKRIPPFPKSERQKIAIIKEVATVAAHTLGNNPAQTLGTYIDPGLWKKIKVAS